MNALILAHAMVVRAADRAPDPEDVKPGGLALVIVLLMILATYLLWRSMNRQLKKVDFDDGSASPKPGTGNQENGDQPA
jgi:hypothetical protein